MNIENSSFEKSKEKEFVLNFIDGTRQTIKGPHYIGALGKAGLKIQDVRPRLSSVKEVGGETTYFDEKLKAKAEGLKAFEIKFVRIGVADMHSGKEETVYGKNIKDALERAGYEPEILQVINYKETEI